MPGLERNIVQTVASGRERDTKAGHPAATGPQEFFVDGAHV